MSWITRAGVGLSAVGPDANQKLLVSYGGGYSAPGHIKFRANSFILTPELKMEQELPGFHQVLFRHKNDFVAVNIPDNTQFPDFVWMEWGRRQLLKSNP
jgi:hypothetical protein